MSKLFVLNCQNALFATYLQEISKTVLITCPDMAKTNELRHTLQLHKKHSHQWLNRSVHIKQLTYNEKECLNLIEGGVFTNRSNSKIKQEEEEERRAGGPLNQKMKDENVEHDDHIMITYLDLDNERDERFIQSIYHIQNMRIFILHDFVYYDTPMLSLHGVIVDPHHKEGEEIDEIMDEKTYSTTEIREYLETMMDLE
jgi:hypothetical protein